MREGTRSRGPKPSDSTSLIALSVVLLAKYRLQRYWTWGLGHCCLCPIYMCMVISRQKKKDLVSHPTFFVEVNIIAVHRHFSWDQGVVSVLFWHEIEDTCLHGFRPCTSTFLAALNEGKPIEYGCQPVNSRMDSGSFDFWSIFMRREFPRYADVMSYPTVLGS